MGSAGQVREDAVRYPAVFSAQSGGYERVSFFGCSVRDGATLLAMHFIQDSISRASAALGMHASGHRGFLSNRQHIFLTSTSARL